MKKSYSRRQDVPDGDSVESREHRSEEDILSQSLSPSQSPARLVVTHDGTLDQSILRRVEGYMHKKGGAVNARGGFRNWKRRWFVLATVEFLGVQGFELQYFDAPGGTMKGKVNLNDVEVRSESKSSHNKKIKYEFQIVLQNGTELQLSCDDEEEREEWIDTIRTVAAYLQKITTSDTILLDGYDPLAEDDEVVFALGEQLAQQCQAFGPGLFGSEAGYPAQFVIQIHDLMGQTVRRGGMPLTATLVDEQQERLYHIAIVEGEDGLYFAHYTLSVCGNYSLSIQLNGEHHIFGSPFEIEIFPAKTLARNCIADGDALQKVRANEPSIFTITARDCFDNRKQRGGDPFEVGVVGAARLVDLRDNADGTYTCSIQGQSGISGKGTGSLLLLVSLYGRPISGSPFKPVLELGGEPLSTSGLVTAVSGFGTAPAQYLQASPSGARESTFSPSNSVTDARSLLHSDRDAMRTHDIPMTTLDLLSPVTPPLVPVSSRSTSVHEDISRSVVQANTTAHLSQQAPRQTPPLQGNLPTAPTLSLTVDPGIQTNNDQPLSRLEMSRQRALLAKTVVESNTSLTKSTLSEQQSQQAAQQSLIHQNSNHLPNMNSRQPLPLVNNDIIRLPVTVANSNSSCDQSFVKPQQQVQHGAVVSSQPAEVFAVRSGSKLSQLAQRSNMLLQAKKQGIPVRHDANFSSPAMQSRAAYISELSSSIKTGLGRFAGTGVPVTQQEIGAWEQTHAACCNDVIVKRLTDNSEVLNQLFDLFSDRVQGVPLIKILTTQHHGGLFTLLERYEIIPNFLSRSKVKTLFTLLTNAQRNLRTPASQVGAGTGLDFPFFIKAMMMFAFYCFSQEGTAGSPESKVDAMLFRWKLADIARLQSVRQALTHV